MASAAPQAAAPLPYLEDCLLLRAATSVLELPVLVAATAAVFLHKCRAVQLDCQLGRQDLVMAVVYAAAKVEEATLSTNHLINVVRMLNAAPRHVLQQFLQGSADAVQELAAGGGVDVLTGEAYYAAKEQLLVAEQHVLRLVRFQLNTDLPHKYLLNLCKLQGASRAVAATALCLLNDAMAYTNLCFRRQPVEVAAAALQLSVALLEGCAAAASLSTENGDGAAAAPAAAPVAAPAAAAAAAAASSEAAGSCGGEDWVAAVGLSGAAVDAAAEELLALLLGAGGLPALVVPIAAGQDASGMQALEVPISADPGM